MSGVFGGLDFSATPDQEWLAAVFCDPPSDSDAGASAFYPRGNGHPAYPNFSIAADVRLHNRSELRSRLGLGASALCDGGDTHLLIAAYEKWGEGCGAYLVGEFAFAIWDKVRKTLFCCRDYMGSRPFFYWKSGTRFLFAASVAAILNVEGIPRRLNRQKLAAARIHAGQFRYPEESFHDGVMILPAACSLLVTADQLRQRTWWTPDIRAEQTPGKPEEVFEALRELLFTATECRLSGHSKIASELSGGLDSSSVTAIAAQQLGKQGRNLTSLACVVPDERRSRFPDERSFIDEFRTWSNVDMRYIAPPDGGPFDWIETPERFAAKPTRTSRLYLYAAMERAAMDAGSSLILQGGLGELGPTYPGARYIVELAASFRWLQMAKFCRQIGAVERRSALRVLAGQFRSLFRNDPPVASVFFTPDFATYGDPIEPFRPVFPTQREHQAAMIRQSLLYSEDGTGQTVNGHIRTGNPLLDKRVVEFCLAAPPETKIRNGYTRSLIRGAMEGILPSKIRLRTDKVAFSPDYFFRYNAQLQKARDFVAAIRPGDPVRTVIDVPRLSRHITPVPYGVKSQIARTAVPNTIYTICFLRQFPEFRV